MNIEWTVVLVVGGLLMLALGALLTFQQDWLEGALWVLSLILFAVLLVAVITSVNRKSCRILDELNGWNHHYSLTNGCLLEVEPGRWIPREGIYSQVEDLR